MIRAEPYYVREAARRKAYKFGLQGSHRGWEALPEALLVTVLGHCSQTTLLNARVVCMRWNFHITAVCKELKPLFPTYVLRLSLAGEYLGVRHLDLTRCGHLRNRQVKRLAKTTVPIDTLLLGGSSKANPHGSCLLSNEALTCIGSMKSVVCLGLITLPSITDAGMCHIFTMTQLRSLHIMQCERLTSEPFSDIQKLTNLQSLTLHKNRKIDLNVVSHLSALTALERFHLAGEGDIALFQHPRAISQLKTLELVDVDVTFIDADIIRTFPQLTALALCLRNEIGFHMPLQLFMERALLSLNLADGERSFSVPRRLFQENWPSHLMTNLRGLKFTVDKSTTAANLKQLSTLRELTALTVYDAHKADPALKALSILSKLRIAEFPETDISLVLLEALANLTQLEKLSLRGRSPQEYTVENSFEWSLLPRLAIAQLCNLRCLDLSHSNLDFSQARDILTRLLGCAVCGGNVQGRLEDLVLEGCLIPREMEDLREEFPAVRIRERRLFQIKGSTQFWEDRLSVAWSSKE